MKQSKHPPPHPFAPLPPAPDHHHHTMIIIMFVSCRGLLFFVFLVVALFCCHKKRKRKTFKEAEIIRCDEHRQVKEEIVEGPGVKEAIVLTVEDDVDIEEEIMKAKRFQKVGEGSRRKNLDTTRSTKVSSTPTAGLGEHSRHALLHGHKDG
ncbi:hypothetical protein SAY87_009433 [Trapa incisa]|uniref:Uncharacterized protein n=1 Tax=Trapa incisa TaxID=236973 RepID=A0AAN7JWK1_9MYRT|nr:hypothetical protein SAY87_009433 [Trapa incisa]